MRKLLVGALITLSAVFGIFAAAAKGHHYHHYGPTVHRADMYGQTDMYRGQDMYHSPQDMY
jgi:hypothetical protein